MIILVIWVCFKVITHIELRDMCLVSELNDILTVSLVHNINFNENMSNAGQIWMLGHQSFVSSLLIDFLSEDGKLITLLFSSMTRESLTKGCLVSVSYSTLKNIVSQSRICLRDNGFQSRRKCQDPCFF